MKTMQQFYLPQLDGLRFFAFFIVFIHHSLPSIPYLKENSPAYWWGMTLHNFGWIGVDVFLCLSSFLLTTLLMIEHEKNGSISIKQFFIRRALRIWPLYYLTMLLAFIVFPLLSFMAPAFHSLGQLTAVHQHLLPFSVFLGNFSYIYFTPTLPIAMAPLWTVSLEEQFYLFWPIMLFILLPKNRKWFFITLCGMIILSMLVRTYIIVNHIPYPSIWVFTLGRLDPFALGAAIAYLYMYRQTPLHPLVTLIAAFILLKIVVSSTGIGAPNTIWQLLAVDLAAALIIYSALYSRKMKRALAVKPLVWLGKISFGLYVFHALMIHTYEMYIVPHFAITHTLATWWISFILTLIATIACATISYYGFEKHFLKLKKHFTIIASRPA